VTAPHDRTPRPLAWAGWLTTAAVATVSLVAGSSLSKFAPEESAGQDVELSVTDEDGNPVEGAKVSLGVAADTVTTNDDGLARLELTHPVAAVVSHDGFLDEPLAIDPTGGTTTVRLWARTDDEGRRRTSVHFGGDVMLGRRFLDAERATPFVHDEASARRVVAELAPMAAAADTTVVNLETVIGDAPVEVALDAKRFLIQSSPFVTAALDELGVDLVTLGNNHAFDWAETGLRTTTDALDAADIAHVGATTDESAAIRGRLVDSAGVSVGVVSATTVNGDFVNDSLPPPGTTAPADVADEDAWQYEARLFGLRPASAADDRLSDTRVPLRPIQISEAWEIVEAAEEHLTSADADAAWKLAWSAFPELQDWVARRGHGGAAHYDADAIAGEIARLERDGADVVIVQLHGGFQFAPVESGFLRRASHAAIDAGAAAVVSHHPHVLQGVEWYDGRLVAHSLGNLVFDQDFHSTFPSALLRIVSDGEEIVEARLLPLVLDRYRPTPLSGAAARDVVGLVAARTDLAATSTRVGQHIRTVLDDPRTVDEPTQASITLDRNSGLIEQRPRDERRRSIETDVNGLGGLPPCAVVRADLLPDDVEVGDELLWWGSFDRSTTAAHRTFPVGWLVPSDHDRWRTVVGRSGSVGDLAVELKTAPNTATTLRIAALVDVPSHRLFDETGQPLDDGADHELRMWGRRDRGEPPIVRLTSYARHDTDPTIDPFTERLRQIEIPIELPSDGHWHEVSIPIPDHLIGRDQDTATAVNIAIVLPPAHLGTFTLDEVELLEWRGPVDTDRPVLAPASRVRTRHGAGHAPGAVTVTVRTC